MLVRSSGNCGSGPGGRQERLEDEPASYRRDPCARSSRYDCRLVTRKSLITRSACRVCLVQVRRALSWPDEAVEFGGDVGGLGCADPLEDIPRLPQVLGGVAGAAEGQGAAAQAGQRAGFVAEAGDLAG